MLPPLLQQVSDLGYVIFTNGSYNLNIIGIRSCEKRAGKFDDLLTVTFRDDRGTWVQYAFECTTDPGLYWLENPPKDAGTAILVPGQYRGSHKLGLHKGLYRALVQAGRVKVYRDDNLDDILDVGPEDEGLFGINIHRASEIRTSVDVGKWSAGCQVFASPSQFDFFIELCSKAAQKWGNSFTYTLVEEEDLHG